jgi:hypothetical protein
MGQEWGNIGLVAQTLADKIAQNREKVNTEEL